MFSIHKILAIFGLSLLLVACNNRPQAGRVTLITESVTVPDSMRFFLGDRVIRYDSTRMLYINSQGMLDNGSKTGSDTLSFSCSKPFLELAFQRIAYMPNSRKLQSISHSYTLLQAGDTVRVRYLQGGNYFFESQTSPELTRLYNLDLLTFSAINDTIERCFPKIIVGYAYLRIQAAEGKPLDSTYRDSALLAYNNHLKEYDRQIDSLVQAGLLPPAYERYYHYRMSLHSIQPIYAEQAMAPNRVPFSPELSAALNDSLCGYISYWQAMDMFKGPLVRATGFNENETPKLYYIDSTGTKPRSRWAIDQRLVFDKLSSYSDTIAPHTLNLIRYLCLEDMRNSTLPPYPEKDKEAYLNKYRALTTDYLSVGYAGLDHIAGLPFRFFLFLAELCLCSWLLFALYKHWLQPQLSYTARRYTLLAFLLVSLAVPLLTLTAQLQLVEKAPEWGYTFNRITQVLFCVYLLGCTYLAYELLCWLLRVERVRKDSMRIREKQYTLCIMMYAEAKPSVFGRKIFFSWNDWWKAKDRESRDLMLKTELYHVRKWHSADSLLLALLRTVCWANPLLARYSKELQLANNLAANQHVAESVSPAQQPTVEEVQPGGLVYGVAGGDYQLHLGLAGNRIATWIHGVKYQIIIPIVLFLIVAFVTELATTLGNLSEVSLKFS